ncbi:MAG: hypothetical protein RLZ83_843 [Pseudomonadota bacterium]|jgi:hypothetical protein
MSLIAVRNTGASSLFTTPVNGAALGDAGAQELKDELDQAKALIEALQAALQSARDAGISTFSPRDEQVVLPAGLSPELREELFAKRMDHSYHGSPLTLDQWSQAISRLQAYVGAAQSQLPQSLGGGIVNMNGIWYVNGQAYTLAEVYLVNRVNTYAEMDRLLTQSLNTIAANNQVVKDMTGGLKYLSTQLQAWIGGGSTRDAWGLMGPALFTSSESGSGVAPDSWIGTMNKFITWSSSTYGSDSQAARLSGRLNYGGLAGVAYNRADALKLRDEIQAYVDSKTSDNQVAQMRTESIFTTRANLLEGMGSFMKGQQNSASTVARNTM